MGKTNKSFKNDDFDDYEDDGRKMHYEKNYRKHERLVNQALKEKNVSRLVELNAQAEIDDNDDDLPEFMKKDNNDGGS